MRNVLTLLVGVQLLKRCGDDPEIKLCESIFSLIWESKKENTILYSYMYVCKIAVCKVNLFLPL